MSIGFPFAFSPFVVTGSVYIHDLTKKIHWISGSKFIDDFEFFSLPVTNSLAAPTPFTKYPFFNLSFSISNLATINRNRSTSGRFLLTWSAANGFPGCPLWTKELSPSAIYFFTHLQIMLRSAWYSFSKVFTETCSFRCLWTISAFCSGVYTRLVWPFFNITTSNCILA